MPKTNQSRYSECFLNFTEHTIKVAGWDGGAGDGADQSGTGTAGVKRAGLFSIDFN